MQLVLKLTVTVFVSNLLLFDVPAKVYLFND